MAFYDWNHNGKKDIQDDYLEYNIYKKSTENKTNNSSSNSSGCLTLILIGLAICFIISMFSQCSKPSVCAVPGCTSECTIDSKYCLEHDFWDRHYDNPTHYDEYNEKKRNEKEVESKTEEKSTYTPSTKSNDTTNYKPYKSKSSDDDPYDVNEYSSPEDFYDDNYDDFWDYEEAEDYYNSYHEDPWYDVKRK